MDSDHVDPVELTLDRAGEISQGRGAPPTEQELAEYRKHEALIAAVLRKLAAPLQMTEQKRSQFRQGMAIYRGLSPEEQKRWGNQTPIELFVHVRSTCGTERPAPTGRPRGRARGVVASRDRPSEPPDEPPPLALIRGFTAASARLIVHLERRSAAMRLA